MAIVMNALNTICIKRILLSQFTPPKKKGGKI